MRETDQHVHEKISSICPLLRSLCWKSFREVTVLKFKVFPDVLMNMALNPKPSIFPWIPRTVCCCSRWCSVGRRFSRFFGHCMCLRTQRVWAGSLHMAARWAALWNTPIENVGNISVQDKRYTWMRVLLDSKTEAPFQCCNLQKPTKCGPRICALANCITCYVPTSGPHYGTSTMDNLCRQSAFHLLYCSASPGQSQTGSGWKWLSPLPRQFCMSPQLAEQLLSRSVLFTGIAMTYLKSMPGKLK